MKTDFSGPAKACVEAEYLADGSILLNHPAALPPVHQTIVDRLAYWAEKSPDAPWLSHGERQICYAAAHDARRLLSRKLLALRLPQGRPLVILADNGIDHALAMLAATAIGMTAAIVSPSYASRAAEPWGKLRTAIEQLGADLILADDVEGVSRALGAIGRTARVLPLADGAWAEDIPAVDEAELAHAEAAVGPGSVAKLLFTSGSTGHPKAVINTQRMMVSNMLALTILWPFLSERPPVMVDWLPWNHTFGGNCCFNIALWFGGHMHIDRGRPAPALIGRSIAAIRRHRPTLYFNVPLGYELLLAELENDPAFAAGFFGRLDFLFNAGAALPDVLRARLERCAARSGAGPVRIVGGWGSTETAPFSTVLDMPTEEAANLGLPIPGTTIKLVPYDERFELRVKGPNVTPGYWRDAAATEAAFDEDGYYRIGDAGRFADPGNPARGIVFDGRVAENFKLSTGTFVHVGALRLAAVSICGGLVSDTAVAGEGRSEIGLILFLNAAACERWAAAADITLGKHAEDPALIEHLRACFVAHNRAAKGTSNRIGRFLIAEDMPSPADGEITEKGYLNQRRILSRRRDFIDRLYRQGYCVP